MRVFLLPLLLLLACPPPVKIDSADSRPVIDSDSPCVPAPEVCDGEDNNCNGEVDEPGAGGEKTWYADTDADAYGDAEKLLKACLPPPGYVEDNTDCDDQQAGTHPGAPEQCNGIDDDCDGIIDPPDSTDVHLWYADADDDGFGDPATSFASCLQPAGYVENGEDCNDRKADVHPEADEYCNEEDDNCNGEVDEDPVDPHSWYVDADGDGYGAAASAPLLACVAPPSTAPYSAINSDCDDSDSTIHPGAIEVCDATRADEDCNGVADDADPGVTGRSTWYTDSDADGYGDAARNLSACLQPAGSVADASDCNDSTSSSYPSASEVCDSLDNNCNGTIDEDSAVDARIWYADQDADGYGDVSSSTRACTSPVNSVADFTDCDDGDPAVHPGATEICDAAQTDEDCNGAADDADVAVIGQSTWYADTDADLFGDAGSPMLACLLPTGYVTDSADCDDTDAAISPETDERCDGLDNNCDGTTDEDSAVDATIWYQDTDLDGYGYPGTDVTSCAQPAGYVADNTDCIDLMDAVYPGAPEICDGLDNDCDPRTPENMGSPWYRDGDGDGYGTGMGTFACSAGVGYVSNRTDCDDSDVGDHPGAAETVANGDDEDCNGVDSCYTDADGDNFGTTVVIDGSTLNCVTGTGAPVSTDCDDNSSGDYPGATETIDNGDDENCDGGETCYDDDDNDGYLDSTGDTRASLDLDCADSYEGARTDPTTDCNDASSSFYPGRLELGGFGYDYNCDGVAYCFHDDDDDGYVDTSGDTIASTNGCTDPYEVSGLIRSYDCDDFDSGDYPGATETTGNGDDEDCDGAEICYDDDDNDGYLDSTGDTRSSTDTDCSDANEGTSTDPVTDCDDADSGDHPGAAEIVGNLDDEDCDGGETCFDDDDDDNYIDTSGDTRLSTDLDCGDAYEVGLIRLPGTDCNDSSALYYPNAPEPVCERDYNCDGVVAPCGPQQ